MLPAGRSRGRAGLNNDAPVWPWVVAGTVVVGGGVVAAIVLARRDAPPPEPPPVVDEGPTAAELWEKVDRLLPGKWMRVVGEDDEGSGSTPNGLPYQWRVYGAVSWAGFPRPWAAVVVFRRDGSLGDVAGWRFWGNRPPDFAGDPVPLFVERGSASSARKAVTMWADSWSALVPPSPPPYPSDFIDKALAGMPTGKYRALVDGGSGVTPNGLPYEWRVYETNLVESWDYAAIVAYYYDGSFGSIGGAPGWRFWGNDPVVAHLVGRGSESAARKAVTTWAESWSALVPP